MIDRMQDARPLLQVLFPLLLRRFLEQKQDGLKVRIEQKTNMEQKKMNHPSGCTIAPVFPPPLRINHWCKAYLILDIIHFLQPNKLSLIAHASIPQLSIAS
jgi:hypothetical protein